MGYVDLHVHSIMSDGSYTPEGIVELAKARGLLAVALTDHDTIDGLDRAFKTAAEAGIEVLSGIEISADYQGRRLHIVALGFDPAHPAFKGLYKTIRSNKEDKMDQLIEYIKNRDIDIDTDKVKPFVNGKKIERYAIMRYLVSLNLTNNVQEIWDKYLNPATNALQLNKNVEVEEVVAAVRAAGGITSLAHFHKRIGLGGMNRTEQEETIVRLQQMGLDGMEKYYTNYTDDDIKFAAAMVDKYNLLATGGTDFHGANRPGVEIGTGNDNIHVPYEVYENILEHCQKI